MATALYTALMTDTGSFRYENTSAATLRLAAELVDAGADPAEVARAVYEQRSPEQVALLGRALSALTLAAEGRVAWMALRRADFAAVDAGSHDTNGIVNYARSIRGVEVGLLFIEEEKDRIRVSFRSKQFVDVAAIARTFGGGGHHRAAGCTLEGRPMDHVQEDVLAEVGQRVAACAAVEAGDAEAEA